MLIGAASLADAIIQDCPKFGVRWMFSSNYPPTNRNCAEGAARHILVENTLAKSTAKLYDISRSAMQDPTSSLEKRVSDHAKGKSTRYVKELFWKASLDIKRAPACLTHLDSYAQKSKFKAEYELRYHGIKGTPDYIFELDEYPLVADVKGEQGYLHDKFVWKMKIHMLLVSLTYNSKDVAGELLYLISDKIIPVNLTEEDEKIIFDMRDDILDYVEMHNAAPPRELNYCIARNCPEVSKCHKPNEVIASAPRNIFGGN